MDKQNNPNAAMCTGQNSNSELELRLSSMQSLVCELLHANQELREALRKAQSDPKKSRGPHPPAQRMETA